MQKRERTGLSQSFTRRSVSVTPSGKLNVLLTFGQWRVGSITTPEVKTQEGVSEAQLLVSLSSCLNEIQSRQSKSYEDLDTSLRDTKVALAKLYNSIGYTAGIKKLGLDNEDEGVIE